MRYAFLIIFCFVVSACANKPASDLKLPEPFLGEWILNEGYLRMHINNDGTMQIFSQQDNSLTHERKYKVLRVYNNECALITYITKTHVEGFNKNWSKPFVYLAGIFQDGWPAHIAPSYRAAAYHYDLEWDDLQNGYNKDMFPNSPELNHTNPCPDMFHNDLMWRES